jgi:stage V sporulation protein G
MPIIDVKINSMYPPGVSGGIRAYASATVDGCLGIRGIKVVEGGRDGLFVSMPSRKTENGYKEICFPVTKEFREQLHKAVLDSYQQAVAMNQAPVQPQEATPEQSQPPMQIGGM